MFLLNSGEELRKLLREQPSLWLPDHLLLLQEYFPVDPAQGIVRMEFLGGKLLYAMRVVSNGVFNLCPSEECDPDGGGESGCTIPEGVSAKPVEFYPYPDVPAGAVEMGRRSWLLEALMLAESTIWRRPMQTDLLRRQREFQSS
jgi:hypothetical protein